MKSVVAAEVAAITAWRVLAVGDRIGAILFNDERSLEARPTRNERKVMGWLGDLADMNNALSVTPGHDSDPEALGRALSLVERSVGHDYLVVLISDFFGWSEATLDTIRRINRHNDIVCSLVFDPLERDISQADRLVVSDGRYQLEIDARRHDLGRKYEASFSNTVAHVQGELKRHDIPVLPVETSTPVTDQLREQLGGVRVRQ
jgi:uncharacterized protein (DUF58 family)